MFISVKTRVIFRNLQNTELNENWYRVLIIDADIQIGNGLKSNYHTFDVDFRLEQGTNACVLDTLDHQHETSL